MVFIGVGLELEYFIVLKGLDVGYEVIEETDSLETAGPLPYWYIGSDIWILKILNMTRENIFVISAVDEIY